MTPRRVLDVWRRCPITVRDLPLALVLAAASLVPALQRYGTQLGDLPDRPLDALAVAVVALESLPLAIRRRWPATCLALVSLGFAVDQLRGYHMTAAVALLIALISTALHLERHRRITAFLASLGYVLLAVALHGQGSTEGVIGMVTFALVLAIAWGIGSWLRLSRAAEAERRRHIAETTRLAERTRIARELHDVLTHHVTAIVVQAEAARYLIAVPERLDEALTAITDTGRRAICDLRHLLDLLNPDHDAPAGTWRSAPTERDRAPDPRAEAVVDSPASANGSASSAGSSARSGARPEASSYGPAFRLAVRRDRTDPGPGVR